MGVVTLRLTPDMMAAAYDFLRTAPPFVRWKKMPESDDVVFKVSRISAETGHYQRHDNDHIISASEVSLGTTCNLLQLIGHEMIHMWLEITGKESKSRSASVHNAAFRRHAAQFCKTHGYDLKAFCR